MQKVRNRHRLKASVDFSNYTGAGLLPVARAILVKMTENAATFPAPPVAMTALETLLTTFERTLAAKASRATADIIAWQKTRQELEAALRLLGNYVNYVANGDPGLVVASGFPSYATRRTPDTSPPPAPLDVRLSHGTVSGTCDVRHRPGRANSRNEIQVTTGDPNVEAGWRTVGIFSGGKATFGGIVPGTAIWVRIRTAGLKGVMGVWSDPARIIVV